MPFAIQCLCLVFILGGQLSPYPDIVEELIGNQRNFKRGLEMILRGDQMLMKDTIAHSVEWSMPINFQGGDN